MVHERYVYKNGRKYGPYYYHSYRDADGKVQKHYLKELNAIEGYGKMDFLWFLLGIVAIGLSAFALVKLFILPLF